MRHSTVVTFLAVLALPVVLGGCSASSGSTSRVAQQRASLHRAKSCGELLSDLRADAAYKLNKQVDLQVRYVRACQERYPDSQCAYSGYGYGQAVPMSTGDASAESSSPQAPSSGSASNSGGSASPKDSASSYSETNTQVRGVDEADIVKNDGKYIYVLHGRSFKMLQAWPASSLAEASSIDIEGTPQEMFVANGTVVVYSTVNGSPLFAAAGVPRKERYSDFGFSGARPMPMDDAPSPSGTASSGPYVPFTKVTVLTLNGTTPSITREVYFEGSYLDSRRVGTHVRTVFQGYQYGPQLKTGFESQNGPNDYPKTGSDMIARLEQLRSENLVILEKSQLTDWLPNTFTKNAAAVSAQTVRCEDFYVPTTGSTESGLTEVASIDLANPGAAPQETAIVGRADVVYGNADTLYLTAHAWVEPPFVAMEQGDATGVVSSPPSAGTAGSVESGSDAPTPAPEPAPPPSPEPAPGSQARARVRPLTEPAVSSSILTLPQSSTHVHKFEFTTSPAFPNYVASGTVVGSVKNQFSLDEREGVLRIATTEDRRYLTSDGKYASANSAPPVNGAPPPERPATVNHLFTLAQNGVWLDKVGDVGELAPNERIFSSRFVGTRGYVVTFRQVDPLFVVDLANPSAPTLLAALKIPGFSEYMHPLGDHHLLTIGRDATPEGRVQGLQLQIFDVTDGRNPLVKHKFTFSNSEYGSSEAQYDHKAFTYFAEKGLLAFPYYSYGGPGGNARSSLELFKVDLTAGITKLGGIDHSSLMTSNPTGYCGGYFSPSVRRGVFLENVVYSISYAGIVAKDVNALGDAGVSFALPTPKVNESYGPTSCW
jgi:hypothetical protein